MSNFNDEYFNQLINISKSTNKLLKDVAETQRQSTKATKKSDHKRTQVKKFVKGIGSVADLAEKKESLQKLLDTTPPKNNNFYECSRGVIQAILEFLKRVPLFWFV